MAEHVQLKFYFGKELAQLLAKKVKRVYPEFKSRPFINRVAKQVDDQQLKPELKPSLLRSKIFCPKIIRRLVRY